MKHPVRFLTLAAVVLLAGFALVACGKSSSSTTSTTSANATTGATAAGSTSTTTSTTPTGGTTTGSTGAGTSGSSKAAGAKRRVKKATPQNSPRIKRRAALGRVRGTALRRCLEENGVKPRSSKSKGVNSGQLATALKRCDRTLGTLLPRAANRSSALRRRLLARPAYRQALARFTKCMRAHGVPDFPEANTSGKGPLFPVGGSTRSPQLRTAQRACIGVLSLH